MTWFKVDDGFGEHPKVDALGADTATALAVWLLCGNASARALTDGRVTESMLARSCSALSPVARRRAADALVRVSLWEISDEGGWRFKDWLDHQPARESVLAERAAARDRQRKARQKKAVTSTVSHAVTSPELPRESHNPDPTRPDPTHLESAPVIPPRTQPGELGRVANLVQLAAIAGYREAGIPAPRETRDMSWKGWADIARFLIDSAELQNWPEDWRDHRPAWLVERFLTDPWAEKRGYPIAHLASNPAEYVLRKTEAA